MGTERGAIPINYKSHFGNVLPQSIRDYTLAWKSDFSITDIGRYKATVALGYGEDGIKSASAITYFWVIPVKWTLITLGVLALFITLIVFMVKAYIRRMLTLAGVNVSKPRDTEADDEIQTRDVHVRRTYTRVAEPLRNGVLDLRSRLTAVDESASIMTIIVRFVIQYKWFFVSVSILIAIFITITAYIGQATESDKQYQVMIDEGENATVLDDQDVKILQE